jgi:hypothetical protein
MFDLEAKIEALLKEFAGHLGNHDGTAARPVHVLGAANEIILATSRVRDRLMTAPAPEPDTAEAQNVAGPESQHDAETQPVPAATVESTDVPAEEPTASADTPAATTDKEAPAK